MKTVLSIYLSEHALMAVTGKGTSTSVKAERWLETRDVSDCFQNGALVEEDAFVAQLQNFWALNQLPRKKVVLYEEGSQYVSKVVKMPLFGGNQKRILQYLAADFGEVPGVHQAAYSYFVLDSDAKSKLCRVFAAISDVSAMNKRIALFQKAGISIQAIYPYDFAMVRLLSRMRTIQKQTAIVQACVGKRLTSLLFVNGVYDTASATVLHGADGTPEQAVEVTRAVDNMLQYASSRPSGEAVSQILLLGFSATGVELIDDMVAQLNATLRVQAVRADDNVQLGADVPLGDALIPVGGLLKADQTMRFSSIDRVHVGMSPQARMMLRVVEVGGVLALIGVSLAGLWLWRATQQRMINDLEASILSMEPQVEAYLAAEAEMDVMTERITRMETAAQYLDSYPVPDSSVIDVLSSCADGLAGIQVRGYSADTGVLRVDTFAPDVKRINEYVMILQQQTLFSAVRYTGYSYDEAAEYWTVFVECTLSETAGHPETTPAPDVQTTGEEADEDE